jgi:uncharacterized protein YxjI
MSAIMAGTPDDVRARRRIAAPQPGRRGSSGSRDAEAPGAVYRARMSLLRRRHDGPEGERFLMREKLLSIGDDFWIENDQGERAYKVDGKALRVRQTFVLEDVSGDEVAKIQEKKLTIRDKITVERGGDKAVTVHKALVGIRDRFAIDVEHGDDMKAHGNVLDHEYEIERDGDTIATISKRWFRVRESYGVEIVAGEDVPLILAIAVAIDSMTTRR